MTLAIALMQSRVRPMEADEMYGFFTAAEPTSSAIMRTQSTAPISLDPPAYHLLSHWAMRLVGESALGARLPSIFGFMLMQWCLFIFVRRLGGVAAGWFAMIFPLGTYTLHYAAQGRPYGWLLGMYCLSLACWQAASRRLSGRGWVLAGLAAALVGAITSHFFGLLVLLPVGIAELVRTLRRRRVDWGMVAAIGVGVASVATLLPYKKAVSVYRAHYYTSMPGIRTISLAYRRLFLDYPQGWGLAAQRNALIVLTVVVLAVCVGAWVRFRHRPAGEPVAEWVAVAVLAALPFFGYGFAVVVTKTMEVRYVMAALLGLTILLALALTPVFRFRAGGMAALGFVVLLAAVSVWEVGGQDRASCRAFQQEMAAAGDGILYTVDMGKFVTHWFYADAGLRQRLTYVYSQEREIALMRHDVNYLTAVYMERMAPGVRVASYEDFVSASRSGAMVVVYPDSGWDWMPRELRERGAEVSPMGQALGGVMERVVIR